MFGVPGGSPDYVFLELPHIYQAVKISLERLSSVELVKSAVTLTINRYSHGFTFHSGIIPTIGMINRRDVTVQSAHKELISEDPDAGGAFGRAMAAGWIGQKAVPLPELGPHVAVVIDSMGTTCVYAGANASFFCSTKPRNHLHS